MNNIKLVVAKDYNDMSEKAAKIIFDHVKNKADSVLGLATGSTPVGMYRNLIEMHTNSKLDFSGVTTFNLDEYYPISRTNDQSYYYFMQENLFKHVNINPHNIYIPHGEASDIETECANYEKQIDKAGGIDLQVLGIGLNGHIGFNEPGTPFHSLTHAIELHESTIHSNARFFESKADVPKRAITMGIKTVMLSRTILLLASGEKKADILFRTLFGEITTDVPSSVLQLHNSVFVIVDREAAKRL